MDELNEFLQKYATIRNKKKEVLKKLLNLNFGRMKVKELKELSDIKIVGVDGGLIKKEFRGIGLILGRAVAVCFEHSGNKLKKVCYFPSKSPNPKIESVSNDVISESFGLYANLRREELELKTAIDAIKIFSPDVLIRDGSIVLYPASVPQKNSTAWPIYKNVLELTKELFTLCRDKWILLFGAVEDSRSKKFCSFLEKELSTKGKDLAKDLRDCKFSDCELLNNLLSLGEYTPPLPYSDAELPFLADLGDFSKDIFVSYLKAAKYDYPLRLDFLVNRAGELNNFVEKVNSIAYFLSKQNQNYAFPSVLIEADARAKLNGTALDFVKSALLKNHGIELLDFTFQELRRESRPF